MARQTPVNPGYEIINGTGTGVNGGRIDVWAEYAFGASDPVNNTTYMTVYFYTALNPSCTSATVGARGLDAALQVGGASGTGTENGSYDFRKAENIHLLASFAAAVPHRDDGTGTVSVTGSFTTASSYISGGNLSAVVALPAIARQTTLAATDCAIGKTSVIVLSPKNTEYVHSVAWQFGQLQGYLDANGEVTDTEIMLTGTTVAFCVPESFYSQLPSATRGSCTLTCRTYLEGALVGVPQTAEFTVITEPCEPVVAVQMVDIEPVTLALTGNEGVLIPGYSRVKWSVSAQAQKYATVESITVAGMEVSENTGEFLLQPDMDLTVRVTDSRGYETETAPGVQVLDYVPVTNLAQIERVTPTATTARLTLSGSFCNGSFGQTDNALTVQLERDGVWQTLQPQWELDEGRYLARVELESLDYTCAHKLQVMVSDKLSTAVRQVELQKGTPVFDWGEEDFVFHVPVSMPELSCPQLEAILERLQKLEELHGSD